MNFGSYYVHIDENGNRTNEVYKCIALVHDYLQSDEDLVLMCKINNNGCVGDTVYMTVENFMCDFEEMKYGQ